MELPSHGDIDGEGNLLVPGQALPSKCPRCGRKLKSDRDFSGQDSPEKPRHRVSKTIKVPKDEQEDGVQILEDAIEILEEKFNPGKHRPYYYTIMDALNFTLLNAGPDDFE